MLSVAILSVVHRHTSVIVTDVLFSLEIRVDAEVKLGATQELQ